jgi:ABC-type branched-subunit amino acid transport system substrate-binding protein
MKTLKVFNNMAEIINNNIVECRLNRQDEKSEVLVQEMIASGEYNVININQSPDINNVPENFDWTQSLES